MNPSNGGATTSVYHTSGPFANLSKEPSINDSGPVTTIADTSGPFASFFRPSINNAGTVSFRTQRDAQGPGIFWATAALWTPSPTRTASSPRLARRPA